jgi:hypothetical protein
VYDHVRADLDLLSRRDLPPGAHTGRGLGRNFLRHLRRTRAILHVLDASSPDPATDYYAGGLGMKGSAVAVTLKKHTSMNETQATHVHSMSAIRVSDCGCSAVLGLLFSCARR